jgi:hypothetical protein
MAYIGKQPVVGNFVKLDAITTSATATYNLLSGGVAYFPQTANNCIVSLNGVIQSPTSAYTISGSTIVFSDALTASDSIDFILVLGDVLNIGTPSDATVTNAKLALTAGSAGTPAISIAADTNTGIFFPAADTIAFTEGGTEAMRMDSSGRLLVGIETSRTQGYGDAASLQLEGTSYPKAAIGLVNNSNSGDAPSINFGKSRGTSVGSNTIVQNGDNIGLIFFSGADGTDISTGCASIIAQVDGTPGSNDMPGRLLFNTTADGGASPTERMRIDSVGVFKASRNAVAYNANSAHQFVDDTVNNYSLMVSNKATSPASQYMLEVAFKSASPDNNSARFIQCEDSTTQRMTVMSDGDLQNHDNSYGSISDERIKQDIRDSNSQWNDIKNIKIRNYKKKDDVRQYGENAWEQIGVVAQELETVSPKLIKHSDPTPSDILSDASFGTLYEEGDEIPEGKKIGDVKEIKEQVKGVSYSVLYMKAIKALQEAMERIEQLETKVTALESKIS